MEGFKKDNEADPSRRKFLGGMGALAASMTISKAAGGEQAPDAREGDVEKKIQKLSDSLHDRYGVRTPSIQDPKERRPTLGPYVYEKISTGDRHSLLRSLEMLRDVFAMYPPELIRTYVSNVQMANKIFWQKPDGSLGETRENGLSNRMTGEIVMRVETAPVEEPLNPSILNHEIAHCVLRDVTLQEWKTLHPGIKYEDANWLKGTKTPTGFVSLLGTKDYAEDMATVSETIFGRARVGFASPKTTPIDDIVKKKMDFLKERYEKVSGGRMNAQYWNLLKEGKVDEQYWNMQLAKAGR